jgi:class 3 adenylate cyclase
VLKSKRWELYAHYSIQDREECLEDAKTLDASPRIEAVCVIRESFNAEENISREAVIYHSPTLKKPPPIAIVTKDSVNTAKPVTPAPRPKGAGRKALKNVNSAVGTAKPRGAASTSPSAAKKPAQRTEESNLAEVLPRLAIVCVAAVVGASMITYVISVLLEFFPQLHLAFGKVASQSILVAAFVIGFLVVFFSLMRRFVPALIIGNARAGAQTTVPLAPTHPTTTGQKPEDAGPHDEDEATTPAAIASDNGLDEKPSPAENEMAETDGDFPVDRSCAPRGDTSKLAGISAEMLQFIGACLAPLAEAERPLDAFNRFGLTLYFCGAGEYLASQGQLSKEQIDDIMCTHIEKLGHTPKIARGFCTNIDEYLVNPKYFQMYEAGRSAMARHVRDPEGTLAVMEAVDAWNEPVAESAQNKTFVAVLFTDIVDSTAITQTRGDAAAKRVVQTHDTIVREALALHGGREIKHTGDGIMATFLRVTDAVDGAIAMQQACRRANADDPELDLGLRIGVNAGEPIHEDGDVFGTPVQLAAGVLSKAVRDEIAVSNLVREMCIGKQYRITQKGAFNLKGFAEPVPVYLLAWKGTFEAPEATSPDTAALSSDEAAAN